MFQYRPQIFRSLIAAALSFSLIVLSPGLAGYQAAAQIVGAGAAGPRVAPIVGLPAALTPAAIGGTPSLPGADAGIQSQIQAIEMLEPVSAPASQEASLAAIAQGIAPELKAVESIDSSPAESAPGMGRRIFDVILGRKSIAASGDALNGASSVVNPRSGLSKAAGYPGDEAVKARKLTETTFVVLDTEISSFFTYAEVSKIIDVGAVKLRVKPDGKLEIIGTYSQLVDPQLPLDIRVTKMNGTTPSDLKGRPTIDQVLPKFREFAGADSVLLAHNAPFDVSFMGYAMRENKFPAMPNLVLDTKSLAEKMFPGLKSYSVAPLVDFFKLGGIEEHKGVSDSLYEAMFFQKEVEKLAEYRKVPIAGLTVGDVAQHSDNLHFDTIFERMAPREVELGNQKPVPENFADEAHRVKHEVLHDNNLPNMLRDLAYAMGLPYDVVRQKLREAHQNVEVFRAGAILEDIAARPSVAARSSSINLSSADAVKYAALIFGMGVAAPLLISHAAAAVVFAGVILTSIGIPQILKNFKEGLSGTKGLAIDGFVIWLGAAVFLSAASFIRHDALGWIGANIAGGLEALVVMLQINAHRRDAAFTRRTIALTAALVVAPSLAVLALAGASATAFYYLALPFLFAINFPQIRQNYRTYVKEGKAPTGIAWKYPALVALGSVINLIPAFAGHNFLWVASSGISIVTAVTVLGQIFAPEQTNAMLGLFPRGWAKLKSLFRRGRGRDTAALSLGVVAAV